MAGARHTLRSHLPSFSQTTAFAPDRHVRPRLDPLLVQKGAVRRPTVKEERGARCAIKLQHGVEARRGRVLQDKIGGGGAAKGVVAAAVAADGALTQLLAALEDLDAVVDAFI
jgi:hypothetical protein